MKLFWDSQTVQTSSVCLLSPSHVKLHSILIYIAANLCESKYFQQNATPDSRGGGDLVVQSPGQEAVSELPLLTTCHQSAPHCPGPNTSGPKAESVQELPHQTSALLQLPKKLGFLSYRFQHLAPTLTEIIISLFLIKRIFISITFCFWIDQLFLFDVRKQEGDVYTKSLLLILLCKII